MRYKILIVLVIGLTGSGAYAQQPDVKTIRIVDTLTVQEKTSRNPVILRSELDSLVRQFNNAHPVQVQLKEPVKETNGDTQIYMLAAVVVTLLLLAWLLYLFYRHQKKFNSTVAGFKRQLKYPDLYSDLPATKNKTAAKTLENKISDLNAELHKLTKENEGLNRVLKEYNGIQHEYDSLKHGISKAYKVKNYPGYDKTKADNSIMQGVLDTEASVATYAYEKFLKPILVITDTNKNNPAKISEEDRQKLVDLLVSLSLLYVEYLYLRVNDLSIGGKMVERIQGFSNGNGLNPSLLKKLNTEHGSRALALRMALDKTGIHKLSYPVFDETDLNNQ